MNRKAKWIWRDRGVAAAINRLLWDEERGIYIDALLSDGRSRRVSQHANGALISFDIAPRNRWDRMLACITD